MKRGLRKLCDIYCHQPGAVDLRAEVEKFLARQQIVFEVHSYATAAGADFWRYAVSSVDIRRVGLPAIDVFERSFQEFQERAKTEVADAKKVLEDETATRERKETARAVLERYQPELKKKKRTRKGATP